MPKYCVLTICTVLLVTIGAFGQGVSIVELDRPVHVRSLSGAVRIPDGGGEIPGALVERVGPDWSTRLEATLTDSEGRFSFKRAPKGISFLQISKPGFNTVRVKVVIGARGKAKLEIELPPST